MPFYVWIVVGVAAVATLMLLRIMTARSEAPASAAEPIEPDGKARLLEGTRYLQYRVGTTVTASPEAIWKLLTSAADYPSWNSTIISIDGTIAAGGHIKLRTKVAPERTFPLAISTFEPAKTMVWQDGNRIFKGVRTFTLSPQAGGSTKVTMTEVLTGAFLPQIAPKLPDFRPAFEAFARDLKAAAE